MVFLPDEKILCTGDAIVNGPFNYTGDGNTGNWPEVVSRALGLEFETILPGHGPQGGREVAEGQRQFFQEINTGGRAGVRGRDAPRGNRDRGGRSPVWQRPWSFRRTSATGSPTGWRNRCGWRYTELVEGKPHGEILGGP